MNGWFWVLLTLTVLLWGTAKSLAEAGSKVTGTGVTQLQGDIGNILLLAPQSMTGLLQAVLAQPVERSLTVMFTEFSVEASMAHPQLLR